MNNTPNNHDANAIKTFLKEISCLFLNDLKNLQIIFYIYESQSPDKSNFENFITSLLKDK